MEAGNWLRCSLKGGFGLFMKISTKNVQRELEELGVPAVLSEDKEWKERRKEILEIIHREYMGFLPDREQISVSMEILEEHEGIYGGKAKDILASVTVKSAETAPGSVSHSFPLKITLPTRPAKGTAADAPQPKIPVFLRLYSHSDQMVCGEEIIDNGFGVVQLNCPAVEPDDMKENFTGFAGLVPAGSDCSGLRPAPAGSRWGKIGCWAFAASCVMDVLGQIPEIDCEKVAVVGHSRLGMTALYAGAIDERFYLVGSVHSGALHRGTQAESFQDLSREYTKYWFCSGLFERYHDAGELPFDNHFLIALSAPGKVYISGATEDLWCDPYSMILSGTAASAAWEACGQTGLVLPEEIQPDTLYADGSLAYYLRTGTHYCGRDDYLQLMKLMRE